MVSFWMDGLQKLWAERCLPMMPVGKECFYKYQGDKVLNWGERSFDADKN